MEKEPEQTLLSRRQLLASGLKLTALFSVGSALSWLNLACEEESDNNPTPTLPKPEANPIFTPENYTSLKFLTNPFRNDSKMEIQQGWYYTWKDESGNPAKHQGIDFIKGQIDNSNTWEPFDVLAAADGWVCANPPYHQGNALFMTHLVNGNPFYTYYGHLEKMEEGIPPYNGKKEYLGGIPIKRGEKIGVAGASGVTNYNKETGIEEPEPTWIHLHFGVQDNNGPLDPYDIHGDRVMYPNPNSSNIQDLGPHSLWK